MRPPASPVFQLEQHEGPRLEGGEGEARHAGRGEPAQSSHSETAAPPSPPDQFEQAADGSWPADATARVLTGIWNLQCFFYGLGFAAQPEEFEVWSADAGKLLGLLYPYDPTSTDAVGIGLSLAMVGGGVIGMYQKRAPYLEERRRRKQQRASGATTPTGQPSTAPTAEQVQRPHVVPTAPTPEPETAPTEEASTAPNRGFKFSPDVASLINQQRPRETGLEGLGVS